MGNPNNPDSIIIKNKFYPKGLKSIDIWNYYQLNKPRILNEIRNRDIMLAIMVELNKPIMKRKISGKKIKLMNSNYDKIITGRTTTIYSTMNIYEDLAIVDIDTIDFKKAKNITMEIYDIMKSFPFNDSVKIKFTGKTSFHVICKLKRKIKIDIIRNLLEEFLNKQNFNYDIGHKKIGKNPLLDISPNKYQGAFITTHSLSIIGLRCMEIPFNKLSSFSKYQSTIKI